MSLPAPAPVYYSRRFRAYLKELWSRREFAWFLAMGNLKARNASTALGLFWWVLNPLLLGLVYFLVFGLVLESSRDIAYLMSGIFVFHFTSRALLGGANSILQNSKLLMNLRFPRLVLPMANLLESAIGFVVSLGVLYLLIIPLKGIYPGASSLLLIVIFPLHLIFNLGLAALSARLAVPFRDINNVIPYLNRIWLYLSPILWAPELFTSVDAPDSLAALAQFNPLFAIISVYRTALLGFPFDSVQMQRSALWALAVGVLGVMSFVKFESKMVRHL